MCTISRQRFLFWEAAISHCYLYCAFYLIYLFNLFGTGVLHLIQINHQPDATVYQFIILTFVYSSTCFGRSPAHYQELNDCSGSLWFYLRIVVTVVPVFVVGPVRPRTQHDYHHDTKVKPEAATAVIKLLIMGGRTPETC